ncbi:hypothetical protein RJT34_30358 [Clitoria ternatea]|uniref:Uncharacterized protein n=1 Tax=Clitoria ternatea TaxID=43366 RepID=A0AAN9I0B2_CLITE
MHYILYIQRVSKFPRTRAYLSSTSNINTANVVSTYATSWNPRFLRKRPSTCPPSSSFLLPTDNVLFPSFCLLVFSWLNT